MGRLSRKKSPKKDASQKSISSFFGKEQSGASKQSNTKLFTCVQDKVQTSLRNDYVDISTSSPVKAMQNNTGGSQSSAATSSTKSDPSFLPKSAINHDSESTSITKDVICVPETQEDVHHNRIPDEDDNVVPATPEVKSLCMKEARRKKLGRSFLQSSKTLAKSTFDPKNPTLGRPGKGAESLKKKHVDKSRNFVDAYRDMLNAQAKDSDEENKQTISTYTSILSSGNHARNSCSKALPSKEKSPTIKQDSLPTQKVTGVKRLSSKGDSPDPKRIIQSRSTLKEGNLLPKTDIFRKRLDMNEECESNNQITRKNKKSDSWERNTRVLDEEESNLKDILKEIHQPGLSSGKPQPNVNSKQDFAQQKTSYVHTIPFTSDTTSEGDYDDKKLLQDLLTELQPGCKAIGNKHELSSSCNGGDRLVESLGNTGVDCELGTSVKFQSSIEQDISGDLKTELNKPSKIRTPKKQEALDDLNVDFSMMSPFKEELSLQSSEKSQRYPPLIDSLQRFLVQAVDLEGFNKILKLKCEKTGGEFEATLEGFWSDAHVSPNDIVHIISENNCEKRFTISDESGSLIVVNPDVLVSGTTVVSCVHCMRRSVLNERFKGFEPANLYMLHGTILHALFQNVLVEKLQSASAIRKAAGEILSKNKALHDMYDLDTNKDLVMEEIEKYIPEILKFQDNQRKLESGLKKPQESDLVFNRVVDIEENLWSPRFGTKGRIDVTMEVKRYGSKLGKMIMPLELKTGRPTYSVEHKGQVALYCMMSCDRRAPPNEGILMYLKDGSMKSLTADLMHQRGLIQLRNDFVYYLNETLNFGSQNEWTGGLSKPINNSRVCSKCPQLINCALYQRGLEKNELEAGHAMESLANDTLGHLKQSHIDYYSHWIRLMHLELATGNNRNTKVKNIWCRTSKDCEDDGEAMGCLNLDPGRSTNTPDIKGNFVQVFIDELGQDRNPVFNVGDFVIVSAESKSLIAVAMGPIASVDTRHIAVTLDRKLEAINSDEKIVYRLDKYESFNAMGINFTNLAKLMLDIQSMDRLRELIIDKCKPRFGRALAKSDILKVKGIFQELNKPQKAAVLKVLLSEDYVLIQGYPGTGKTTMIVCLVRILNMLGKSVLLAAYTHSAVDNILLKLLKHNIDIVRLGREERVHVELRNKTSEKLTQSSGSVADLRAIYSSKAVVATTCLGTNHPAVKNRQFDVCIVDEASQVMQPSCLGPIFAAKKFVLVGDPKQLPPVVVSKAARDGGLSESLFRRLNDTGATFQLNLQYRMNSEIMRLSNELVYSGDLKCGSSSVANSLLQYSNLQVIQTCEPSWLSKCLLPEMEVSFLDTDPVINGHSIRDVSNQIEGGVCLKLITTAIEAGSREKEIGIITPYRQQVSLIRQVLAAANFNHVEVNTVDQYQGRDKQLIIISFVKSSNNGNVSEILKDVRRLNVALTRAKHKLIMIGSISTLSAYDSIKSLISILRADQILQITDLVHESS